MKTLSQWLEESQALLKANGIESSRLDVLILLEDVLGKDRTHILAHPELKLTHEQHSKLQKLLDRRLRHEPIAYIRGKTEFYGREFIVTKDVLEPRPETEDMIDQLLNLGDGIWEMGDELTVVDVGTGSGALAITTKLELPKAMVFGIDIDEKCLKIADQNAVKHNVDITFIQSDLLSQLPTPNSQLPLVILANLPYVPTDYQINKAAFHEPSHAIFGGKDGLDFYRTLFRQLEKWQDIPIFVFTESLMFQHEELQNIARTQNFNLAQEKGLVQLFSK